MALNKTTLMESIKAAILNEQDAAMVALGLSPTRTTLRVALAGATAKAIADEVIDHFVASAVVTVDSVSGVQPGAGTSGPGTGSIS